MKQALNKIGTHVMEKYSLRHQFTIQLENEVSC